MSKVNRAIEQNRTTHSLYFGTHQDVPVIVLLPDEGVSEMTANTNPQFSRRAVDHRITRVLLPGQQIIGTGCHADDLGMNPAIQQRRDAIIIDGASSTATVGIGSP